MHPVDRTREIRPARPPVRRALCLSPVSGEHFTAIIASGPPSGVLFSTDGAVVVASVRNELA